MIIRKLKRTNSIKLLGINIDDQLKFNEHISILCSKGAMQLNALSRLLKYRGKSEKEAIINSLILSNFSYCLLVWHLSSCESIRKGEKIQKPCLGIILNDYESDYKILLHISKNSTMEVRRLRALAVKNIFTPKENSKVRQNDNTVNRINSSRFGTQSLKSVGLKIWNNLSSNIKSETWFPKFKEYIKT